MTYKLMTTGRKHHGGVRVRVVVTTRFLFFFLVKYTHIQLLKI